MLCVLASIMYSIEEKLAIGETAHAHARSGMTKKSISELMGVDRTALYDYTKLFEAALPEVERTIKKNVCPKTPLEYLAMQEYLAYQFDVLKRTVADVAKEKGVCGWTIRTWVNWNPGKSCVLHMDKIRLVRAKAVMKLIRAGATIAEAGVKIGKSVNTIRADLEFAGLKDEAYSLSSSWKLSAKTPKLSEGFSSSVSRGPKNVDTTEHVPDYRKWQGGKVVCRGTAKEYIKNPYCVSECGKWVVVSLTKHAITVLDNTPVNIEFIKLHSIAAHKRCLCKIIRHMAVYATGRSAGSDGVGRWLLRKEFTDDRNVVDHINRCPLDNRRVNLRVASDSENNYNLPGRSGDMDPDNSKAEAYYRIVEEVLEKWDSRFGVKPTVWKNVAMPTGKTAAKTYSTPSQKGIRKLEAILGYELPEAMALARECKKARKAADTTDKEGKTWRYCRNCKDWKGLSPEIFGTYKNSHVIALCCRSCRGC